MGFFDTKTKTQSTVNPYDPGQLQDIIGRLQTLGATPQTFFPGQTYAGLDPRQTEALQMQEDYARNLGGMVDPTMAAWQSTLTAPDVANNPYVQGMLEQQADIAGRQFREELPGMESAAIAAGQLGGSRQGVVEALRERGIRESLAQSAAQTQLGAYQQGLAQQRYGLSAAPGMMELGMRPAGILGDVGQFYRGEEQRAIDEEMARHQFAQEEPWQRLERQAGLFNQLTLPYAARETTSREKASGAQMLGQSIGLASSIAGLGLGLGGFGGGNPFGMMPAMGAAMGGYGTTPLSQQSRMLAEQMV